MDAGYYLELAKMIQIDEHAYKVECVNFNDEKPT
jgi:hypothetical protein